MNICNLYEIYIHNLVINWIIKGNKVRNENVKTGTKEKLNYAREE